MRVTPAGTVMGCSAAGYEHGGQSSVSPPTFADQARGEQIQGPHKEYSQEEIDARARAGAGHEATTWTQSPFRSQKQNWRQTAG